MQITHQFQVETELNLTVRREKNKHKVVRKKLTLKRPQVKTPLIGKTCQWISISDLCRRSYFHISKRSYVIFIEYRHCLITVMTNRVYDALHYLLENIFIKFGSKLYRQIVCIPMGTNCAPLVADLFLLCYERDFMLPLSENNQTDIIEAFNSTSRYLDELLNIDNPYVEQMVGQIYPTELRLNKTNSSETEAPFLDLNLSITNGIVSSKIYDKRDDFNFEIVNFPFLDGDVPRSPSYGVYISQLIRFARVFSNVDDFYNRNLFLTDKSLKQGYRYHKIRKSIF